jgi:hypothetical protein
VTLPSARLPPSSPPAHVRSRDNSARKAHPSRRSSPTPAKPRPALPNQRRSRSVLNQRLIGLQSLGGEAGEPATDVGASNVAAGWTFPVRSPPLPPSAPRNSRSTPYTPARALEPQDHVAQLAPLQTLTVTPSPTDPVPNIEAMGDKAAARPRSWPSCSAGGPEPNLLTRSARPDNQAPCRLPNAPSAIQCAPTMKLPSRTARRSG